MWGMHSTSTLITVPRENPLVYSYVTKQYDTGTSMFTLCLTDYIQYDEYRFRITFPYCEQLKSSQVDIILVVSFCKW